MDHATKEAAGKGNSSPAPSRPKPFVTILDGKSVSGTRKRRAGNRRVEPQVTGDRPRADSLSPRKGAAALPGALVRKNSIRLQSYARESILSVAKMLAKLPSRAFGAISGLAGKTKAAMKKRSVPPSAATQSDPAERTSPWIQKSAQNPASVLRRAFAAVWGKIVALSAYLPRKPYVAFFIFIAILSISAGTSALIGARNFPVSSNSLLLPDEDSVQAALLAYLEPDDPSQEEPPAGTLPPVPLSLSMKTYAIRSGDTIEKIAKRFGLRQDTLISMNNLQSAQSIRPGVQLRVPNMDGISHKVKRGENLSSLSKVYGIDMTRIVDANDLTNGTINAGQSLFIPNARLSSASLHNFYGETFMWPARGSISSPFGYRSNPFTGLKTFHSAIDIVMPTGTRVKATSAGTVADTGYNSVFGNYIILKHANGYQSLYGHLSGISVREGTKVEQGAVIGNSGNTGQSTGPHLHFSIFKNGQALDPRKYVK